MAITSTELESYSGDDFTRLLTFTDKNGTQINISNYTLYITIKKKYSDLDANAVYQDDLTTLDFTDPVHGITTITIPHASTEMLDGVYVIDVKYKDSSGKVGTALNGRINFFTGITKRASV